jgi:hypothetical protein
VSILLVVAVVLLAVIGASCGQSPVATGGSSRAVTASRTPIASATPTVAASPPLVGPVSWSTVSSPNPSGSTGAWLYGLTCVTADDCWGVGYWNSTDSESHNQPLFEHDTGSGWSIVDGPAVPGSTSSQLQAMTCAGAGDCWAVGYYADASGADHTLIEHYTGGSWTVVSSPTPAGDGDINLDGVTCVSADECWAVGYSDASGPNSTGVGTVIEEYTGSGWTIVTGPTASGGRTDELAAVTCVSAADCWAVGAYYVAGGSDNQGLIEQYTGHGWSVVSSPLPPGSVESSLSSITCAGADDCWAVGGWGDVNFDGPTLIEQDTGSGWSIVPSPVPPGSTQSALNGVSCASAADCWAVGFSGDENFNTAALIEQDTGAGWTIVSDVAPSGNAGGEVLSGTTCMDTGHCVAVGYGGVVSSSNAQTLIEGA